MNKIPIIWAIEMLEVNRPLIDGSDISPKYIGRAVYKTPSYAPIMNLVKQMKKVVLENARRTKSILAGSAIHNVVVFLPILSTMNAARIDPTGAPTKGITAHHVPSSLVMNISGLVPFKIAGKYGEVHPKFIPEVKMAREPRKPSFSHRHLQDNLMLTRESCQVLKQKFSVA